MKKIVFCDYNKGELIPTYDRDDISGLNFDERSRIIGIIEAEPGGYDIKKGLKYYLVDKFYDTNFIKSSDYAMRSKRYIWLDEIEGFKEGMSAEQVANLLNDKKWE